MKSISYFLLLFALVFSACSGTADKAKDAASGAASAVTDAAKKATDKVANKYTLTPFAPSTEYADAKINSVSYTNGKFKFDIADGSYKLGTQTPDADAKMCANSAKGQHIHLIANNAPYSAQYTDEFDYPLGHGDFYILGFLSRSYHESIKTADAHWLKKAHVHGNSIQNPQDVKEPMVFYSRPKGNYVGKVATEKVMLDFYLANVTLGDNYKVQVDINGETHMVDKWQPYYIEGMPMGKNTVKLTLVDGNGATVRTPLNPVTRSFTLAPDPLDAAKK